MTPFRSRSPVLVAVVGIVLLAASLFAAANVNRLPLIGDGPTYHANIAEAGNLAPGSEVRIAGIKVGAVDDVALVGAHVAVTFHVDDGTAFGPQTRASVELKTLLGEEYLALHPAGAGQMAAGATIPLGHTSSPYEIIPAFGHLTSTVADIDTKRLAQALTTLAGTFRHTPASVRGALTGLSRLSRTISSRDAGISRLLSNLRGVSGTLAANSQKIVSIIGSTNEVLAELDQRSQVIGQLLTATQQLARQVSGLVADNRSQLGPALRSLDTVAGVLDKDRSELSLTIHNLRPFVTVFTSALGTGGFFDATIKFGGNLAVCDTEQGNSVLSKVLDPVLSSINEAETGKDSPCLPLAAPSKTGGGG